MLQRILFVFVLIFTVIINPLFAQTEKKQSLSLSYHPVTMYAIKPDRSAYMHNSDNRWFGGVEFEALFGDYGYKAVGYDTYYYGELEIAYKRILNKYFQFNIGLGCELSSKHWDLYDIPDGPQIKRIMDYRIILLPGIDIFLFNQTPNRLYLSGQAGAMWIRRGLEYFDNNERNKQNFAWQFWFAYDHYIENLFCIDMGIGYGTLGIIKIGISYPF